MTIDSSYIDDIFGKEGVLARRWHDFEYREGQWKMAHAVAQAFNDSHHLLVEAGTGTGKSLAYLVPAMLSGEKVVVSTLTKNLQEQLFLKDIPFIQRTLGIPAQVHLLKGRNNYLCQRRLESFLRQPYFEFREETQYFDRLNEWAATTQTGDRAELDFLPENVSVWSSICSTTDTCSGLKCPHRKTCFFEKSKNKAKDADLIIVNHHLLFADVAIRVLTQFAGLLPQFDRLVIDEAHEMEEVATNYFSMRFSQRAFHLLIGETERTLYAVGEAEHIDEIFDKLDQLRKISPYFFSVFNKFFKEKTKFRMVPRFWTREAESYFNKVRKEVKFLNEDLSKIKQHHDEIPNLIRRWGKMMGDAKEVVSLKKDTQVYWAERTPRNVTLGASPIEIGPYMAEHLFDKMKSCVLTSATLTTNGSFEFLRKRIGLEKAEELIVESPFNFRKQAILYAPRRGPDPREDAFSEYLIEMVRKIILATEGKAFVLFTSIRRMKETYEAIAYDMPFRCLLQGQIPKHKLLSEFKTIPNSVLFATSSFWHGVDVVGAGLSCVIIDKLPFSVPDEPVVQARIEYIKNRGGNAFMDYMVPHAIIALKQGVGRLIRSKTDYGVVVILDKRFMVARYGSYFRASMPPLTLTDNERCLWAAAKAIKEARPFTEVITSHLAKSRPTPRMKYH